MQSMFIVEFYYSLVCRKAASLVHKTAFWNQNHNFICEHIRARSVLSVRVEKDFLFFLWLVTVPFSQSLTPGLGTIASLGWSNLSWVWHDHVSVELVKTHYSALVIALCFYGEKRTCSLSGINSEWYRQMIPDPVCALLVQNYPIRKLWWNPNWQSEVIPDQHFVLCGSINF